MDKCANIYRLGVKELRILFRDPVLIALIVWTFSGGIYSIATSTSMELHNAPIAAVDEDQSQLSGRIIGAFYGPYFKKPELISGMRLIPAWMGENLPLSSISPPILSEICWRAAIRLFRSTSMQPW